MLVLSACLLFTDDFTEELLNQHEAEVKTLERYYEDHRELFEGVAKWRENWTLYLELDVNIIFLNVTNHLKHSVGGVTHGDLCIILFRKRLMTPQGSPTEVGTF